MRKCLVPALLCLLLLGGCTGAPRAKEPEHVFRYAENQPADYPTTLGAYRFAELVEERSGGRIKIFVYPDAELGDERSVIEQMQYGGIDFGRVNLSPLSEYDQRLFVLQLPYLYRDGAHMWRVLDGEIGKQYLSQLSDIGVVGLAWVDAGARNFYTKDAPIRSLKDMRGLSIRVQENAMMERLVELLGAEPVQMRYSEVLPALQTGKIDGAENNFPSYKSMDHYLVAQYMVEDEHSRIPEAIIASQAAMRRLSEADRLLVEAAAHEAAAYQRELWRQYEQDMRNFVLANGCEVYPMTTAEKEAFMTVTETLYQEFAADELDTIARIQAI